MSLKRSFLKNANGGFTLIELLVVVAIIGILASVILASLNNAKTKGSDAGVKSNLKNAISQAEIFYATNTIATNTFTNVCTNGVVGGANGIGAFVLNAAKASGLAAYGINNTPAASLSAATCNFTGTAWAAEVPLKNVANQVWCVDSTGKSTAETSSIGAGTSCL